MTRRQMSWVRAKRQLAPHGAGALLHTSIAQQRLTDCPICKATGRLQSRLPFRKKICGECGGTGKQRSGAQRRAASHGSKAELPKVCHPLAQSFIPSEELSL